MDILTFPGHITRYKEQGFYNKSKDNYVLLVIDTVTKYVFFRFLKTRMANEFCQAFKYVIDRIKHLKERTVFTEESGMFFCDLLYIRVKMLGMRFDPIGKYNTQKTMY